MSDSLITADPTTRHALASLGVAPDTLSRAEVDALDTYGYVTLANILSTAQLDALTDELSAMIAREGDLAGSELGQQEEGVIRLSNLVDKGEIFDVFFSHPRVLAAISHVLGGDMKLSSLNFRASLPGHGLQGLHADWGDPPADGTFAVCNSIWLLDDFTAENGATRLVPGTHRSGTTPARALQNPVATHPDEALLIAPRGSVTIFNSHTWHGGTLNRSAHPRRALHSYWTRRALPQQTDQAKWLSETTKARMSAAQTWLLGI